MSEISHARKLPRKNSLVKLSSFEDSIFNSKLFIDLDSTYDYSSNNSYEKDSEDSNEIDDINNGCFLIKELIEELDSPKLDIIKDEKKDNSINYSHSLLSLVKNGYEFMPKGYIKYIDKNTSKKKNKFFNKYNLKISNENINNFNLIKNKSIKERKGDWLCHLCLNLNFAFRTKCNRCKAPKESCIGK